MLLSGSAGGLLECRNHMLDGILIYGATHHRAHVTSHNPAADDTISLNNTQELALMLQPAALRTHIRLIQNSAVELLSFYACA